MKELYIYQFIICIIFILIVLFSIKLFYNKNNINQNSYMGTNMKCNYCMLYHGYHYHHLSENLYPKYINMASSGKHCNYCMKHLGELHFHYQV